MVTPVWVITGLLDSGKTTLINNLIEHELAGVRLLVVQFETGDVPLAENRNILHLRFTKSHLEEKPLKAAAAICQYLRRRPAELVLVEWNGMEHFHTFEKMLLQFSSKRYLSVEKVIYAAAEEGLRTKISDAGSVSLSQIAASDYACIQTGKHRHIPRSADVLYQYNPSIQVFTSHMRAQLAGKLLKVGKPPGLWLLTAAAIALCYFSISVLLENHGISMSAYITVFMGVFLQAAPFLAIGVLLSSWIQVFVQPEWIRRKFPKRVLPGQLFAVIAGFCLPVCDCASIPVFKSLMKQGVPLPAAITFMLVSPIINPVVILSTWYAFHGDLRMIAARCGLGILCAMLIGLTFLIRRPEAVIREEAVHVRFGGYTAYDSSEEGVGRKNRLVLMLRHAQNEFFAVGKFLLVGILVSTLFQRVLPNFIRPGNGLSVWAALLLMMGLAFLLSLCSSSDAVVARSLVGSVPTGTLLGFLVFGPMMDIKNTAMLLSGFHRGFVVRLMATAFVICFVAVAVFILCGSGGIRI